jgi:hypothetical protein
MILHHGRTANHTSTTKPNISAHFCSSNNNLLPLYNTRLLTWTEEICY